MNRAEKRKQIAIAKKKAEFAKKLTPVQKEYIDEIVELTKQNTMLLMADVLDTAMTGALVEDTDLRRCSYHNYYTGEEWGNAEYYDICIDVSKVGEDGALRLIEAYINETGVL